MNPKHFLFLGLIALAVSGCADPPAFQFNIVAKKTAENDQAFDKQQVQDVKQQKEFWHPLGFR